MIALLVGLAFGWNHAHAAEGDRFFREKIEPILRERCFECHSHESGKTKGGLTLDSRTGWREGGFSGPAIVPGKPEESLLVRAVRRVEADSAMPPKKPLPEAEVALLAQWVEHGASDPRESSTGTKPTADWWSLKPLRAPGEFRAWLGEEPTIDAFLRRGLRDAGLTASPEADRRTLARRLYVDLHGLQPSPEEVQAFVQDAAPDAYGKLVDKLLASPRYGERWARHWFDTIHFADTHGFEHDLIRPNAWRFRDYVIRALNEDTSWPRFIREQIAADVFFPEQPAKLAALGFLGAGPFDASAAGTAPKMFELVERDDIVVQTMAAFSSVTAGCARCHDHKFDPITQEDYYSLSAVFAGITKGDLSYDEDATVAASRVRWERWRQAVATNDRATLLSAEAAQLTAEWERGLGPSPSWSPADVTAMTSAGSATLERQADGAILVHGTRPDKDTTTVKLAAAGRKISALRLEVLPDPALPKNGPGRQDNGNFHLNEIEVYVENANGGGEQRVAIGRAVADFNQDGWTVSHAFDGNEKTGWAIHPRVGEPHQAVFVFSQPISVPEGGGLRVLLKQVHGQHHLLGKFRISLTDAAQPDAALLPAEIASILPQKAVVRSEDARFALAKYALQTRATAELARLPAPAAVYAAGRRVKRDGDISIPEPRVIHVLARGELTKPGAVVTPGAIAAIVGPAARFDVPDPKNEALRRAALADWLAHDANPLTWRSVVNRVWHHHFGRGIVDTPNDLGRMGALPSHPELLDWLAADFRASGGSLKRLHRMIVTSAAYRQQSAEHHATAAQAADRENRLLWRANRLRLDAESYRDSVMQIAGDLDLTMGGPSVLNFKLGPPVQSTPTLDYTAFDWGKPGVNRRSIYRLVYRNIADPFMTALDFPDAAQLSPNRPFSASPLQSLVLWNDAFVLHFSERLARRVQADSSDLPAQLHRAAQLIFLRRATEEESGQWATYVQQHGMAALCRVLLNSNEFLFVN